MEKTVFVVAEVGCSPLHYFQYGLLSRFWSLVVPCCLWDYLLVDSIVMKTNNTLDRNIATTLWNRANRCICNSMPFCHVVCRRMVILCSLVVVTSNSSILEVKIESQVTHHKFLFLFVRVRFQFSQLSSQRVKFSKMMKAVVSLGCFSVVTADPACCGGHAHHDVHHNVETFEEEDDPAEQDILQEMQAREEKQERMEKVETRKLDRRFDSMHLPDDMVIAAMSQHECERQLAFRGLACHSCEAVTEFRLQVKNTLA